MLCHGMGSDRHAGTENCNLPSFCNEGAPTANHRSRRRRRSTKLWQIVYGVFKWPCNRCVVVVVVVAATCATVVAVAFVALTFETIILFVNKFMWKTNRG